MALKVICFEPVTAGVSVTGRLAFEVPPLHDALEPLAVRNPTHVHQLARSEMAGTYHESHRQHTVFAHSELLQLVLGCNVVFQVVSDFWFF